MNTDKSQCKDIEKFWFDRVYLRELLEGMLWPHSQHIKDQFGAIQINLDILYGQYLSWCKEQNRKKETRSVFRKETSLLICAYCSWDLNGNWSIHFPPLDISWGNLLTRLKKRGRYLPSALLQRLEEHQSTHANRRQSMSA